MDMSTYISNILGCAVEAILIPEPYCYEIFMQCKETYDDFLENKTLALERLNARLLPKTATPGDYFINQNPCLLAARSEAMENELRQYDPPMAVSIEDRSCRTCKEVTPHATWQLQLRSGDEPMSCFYRCTRCRTQVREG